MPVFRSAPPAKVAVGTGQGGSYDRSQCRCARLICHLFLSGVSCRQNAMGRMPELTATADQALIRASKAHTGIRREIPVSVAREYGKRRSLTILGDFSDRLRHPGHRIICVQVSPFSSGPDPVFSSFRPQSCAAFLSLTATPFMAGSSAAGGAHNSHAAPSAPVGSVIWAMAQMKPTSSRATAVTASADFLPRAIRRR